MADAELAPPPPPQNVQPGDYLVVVHGHAGGEDELQMKCNQLIRLVELDDEFQDGWWLGEHPATNEKGLFPAGFTRKARRHESEQFQNSLRIDSTRGTFASEETESPAQIEPSTPRDKSFGAVGSEQTTPQASRQNSVPEVPTMSSPGQQRSASSPLPQSSLAADIQNAFRPSGSHHVNGEESPVMNETLSVIDEHITDMNTPRHSMSTQDAKTINDSGSEYSTHISHRLSYINGHETEDEEEGTSLTEQEVRRWTQMDTSNHLRSLGVEPKHCEIFEREEITGDVLLEMNQDFIFMKEFDFGVMGKRLKTWHKIKALQEEVKGSGPPPTRGSMAGYPSPHEERSGSRAGHTGTFLPRIPTVSEKTGAGFSRAASMGPSQHPRLASNNTSPMTPMTPPQYGNDSRRISAASIRDFNHSRRHSSIDATQRGVSEFYGHQKKPSFDRSWTLNGGTHALPPRPGTSVGTPTEGYRTFRGTVESEPNTPDGVDDLDRGYFSGTEVDSRRTQRRLQKRNTSSGGSLSHSRKSSYQEEPFLAKPPKRQSRIASVDSLRDADKHTSAAAKLYNDSPAKSRLRSLSQRNSAQSGSGRNSQASNTDTKSGFFSNFGMKKSSESDGSGRFQPLRNVGPKMRRAVGMRAISDAASKDSSAPVSPRDFDPKLARTGSTTPSATSKSSERHSTDGSGKAGDVPGLMNRPRTVKSKKDTSAYTRGLEKKSPQEQIAVCDYSGWMKKRSSNLMTTWKPRLFVLRGRRLSYYYAEDDTEERGLIDITAHRVLRADNDPIITLHATVTGSTALPANASATEQSGVKLITPSVLASMKSKEGSGPFFFKLVPPKSNNSRTVQFTKPTTHYFQVDSVEEGRLWMAALMKATIERDLTEEASTTNKQKTISLKQARLMNQRPPALMNNPHPLEDDKLVEEKEEEDEGLRIEGLNLTKSGSSEGNSYVDAKGEQNGTGPNSHERAESNHLGEIETGPTSLLPSPLTRNDSF